jgi:hypothetical protein
MDVNKLIVAGLALVATAAGAQEGAADDDALELTMVLLPENATLPDAVTRVITLPDAASEAAAENAASGLDQANAAREAARERREDGLENAAEASEAGRERAQQNREDRGRGAANGLNDSTGPPDSPAPPDGGPGQGGGPPDTPGPPGD